MENSLPRLCATASLPGEIAPRYTPEDHGAGIVHIGLGAFAKAHVAEYTEDALIAGGGDWRITGVSLRNPEPAEALTPQDCRYTLIKREGEKTEARVIGALAGALCAPQNPDAVIRAMHDPACRIVSLTVTEKGYGINRAGGCDPEHEAVAHDLQNPDTPKGVLGLIVHALGLRKRDGLDAFTVLCCDNLPDNGALLRDAVFDFARRAHPGLEGWIAEHVAFPSTMVDRITPASTDATRKSAMEITGHTDMAAVEAEMFRQWVIEDNFPAGRPAWEKAGALFVENVSAHEKMKHRMLNGSHSMLAYTGHHLGMEYIFQTVRDGEIRRLLHRHLAAAAGGLPPIAGVDLDVYASELEARFGNSAIAHAALRVAMDGTEKIPQRLFDPSMEAMAESKPIPRAFAFTTAAWMCHAAKSVAPDASYILEDPRADEIHAVLQNISDAPGVYACLAGLPGFMPEALRENPAWRDCVIAILAVMLQDGMRAAVHAEAENL